MKNTIKFLCASFGIAALVACSDMAVNENEALNAPSDFVLADYLAINKDIRAEQVLADLKKNKYYNAGRMDSLGAMNKVDKEGEICFVYEKGVCEGFKAGTEAKKARDLAKADTAKDNAAFLSDVELVRMVFTDFIGFNDSLWNPHVDSTGVLDSIDSDIKAAVLRFNRQQIGAPNTAEDRKYLEEFTYDESLFEKHYLLIGIQDGRAYRYCNASDSRTLPFADVVPDTIRGSGPFALDYSARAFCYDSTNATVYSIK